MCEATPAESFGCRCKGQQWPGPLDLGDGSRFVLGIVASFQAVHTLASFSSRKLSIFSSVPFESKSVLSMKRCVFEMQPERRQQRSPQETEAEPNNTSLVVPSFNSPLPDLEAKTAPQLSEFMFRCVCCC